MNSKRCFDCNVSIPSMPWHETDEGTFEEAYERVRSCFSCFDTKAEQVARAQAKRIKELML